MTRHISLFLIVVGFLLADISTSYATGVGLKIRFGLKDDSAANWTGSAAVSPGRVVSVQGWRFDSGDEVVGADAWVARTRLVKKKRRTNLPAKARAVEEPPLDNGVVVMLDAVTEESRVRVETAQGTFDFTLSAVPFGARLERLGGAVEIERTAWVEPLTSGIYEDDFPAAAVDGEGRTHVAWTRFSSPRLGEPRVLEMASPPADFRSFAEPTGGDQLLLTTLDGDGAAQILAVTDPGRDLYKCAVAVDGSDRAWVFWAERLEGRFDVWGRSVWEGRLGPPIRISQGKQNDHSPVAVADANGRIWVAWQGVREGTFQVLMRHQKEDGSWSEEKRVSPHRESGWAPVITATRKGAPGAPRVAVVWDTYEKGDYDIWFRTYDLSGQPETAQAVANSREYQARPSATYDASSNLWIAWEFSGATWGKDLGRLVRNRGVGLLRDRQIGLLVRSRAGTWLEPTQSLAEVMPTTRFRSIPKRDGREMRLSEAARAAQPYLGKPYHNLSRLALEQASDEH